MIRKPQPNRSATACAIILTLTVACSGSQSDDQDSRDPGTRADRQAPAEGPGETAIDTSGLTTLDTIGFESETRAYFCKEIYDLQDGLPEAMRTRDPEVTRTDPEVIVERCNDGTWRPTPFESLDRVKAAREQFAPYINEQASQCMVWINENASGCNV